MPERQVQRKARKQMKRGKSPNMAAAQYVREEIRHVRKGKHGARSTEQAIAIGLSKARRAGIPVGQPQTRGKRRRTRTQVAKRPHKVSPRRARAVRGALKREPHRATSHRALASHGRTVSRQRGHAAMSRSAKKAARTRKRRRAAHR